MTLRPWSALLLLLGFLLGSCGGRGAGTTNPAAKSPKAANPGDKGPTKTSKDSASKDAASKAAATETGPAPVLLTSEFGGSTWGFGTASSANGRFVFVRRFAGKDKPSFGHHGEPMGAWPTLTVFDRVAGTEREIDELIDGAGRRWFLVLASDALFLLDSATGEWQELDNVDMANDGNRCLAPRQATFSKSGARVAWVAGGASHLQVLDTQTGDEWSVSSSKAIWRGWAQDEGQGAVLMEVADSKTWPQQNTSCACRWCGRFALSYGVYGWGGPSFAIVHVAEDGKSKAWDADPPGNGDAVHGKSAAGCTLTATSGEGKDPDASLSKGPWHWECP